VRAMSWRKFRSVRKSFSKVSQLVRLHREVHMRDVGCRAFREEFVLTRDRHDMAQTMRQLNGCLNTKMVSRGIAETKFVPV